MGKFLSLAETAEALISQFGGEVSVKRLNSANFDPITQTEIKAGSTEIFKACVLPPSREATYKLKTLELSATAEVYFALKDRSFIPGPGDTFDWNGKSYTINHSQTYDPAADGAIFSIAYAI
jgi:hypothetical protein